MKKTDRTIIKPYQKALPVISILTLVILIMSFITYDKSETDNKKDDITSISIIDNGYKIDTNIAVSNWCKEKLISIVETEKLTDKKTVAEIPGFIKSFLDGTTVNNEFYISDPGEEWQEGGWLIGLDSEKKAILHATSSVAKPFPNRQLIYCGIGKNIALISYYIGGIETKQNNIIIKFQNEKVVDVWFDHYYSQFGYSLGGTTDFITTKIDIIKYIKNMNSGGC
jgi:hypothetical protein